MCGLVGILSSNFTEREKKIFRWLHVLDVVRGKDAAGFMAAHVDGRTEVHKELHHPVVILSEAPDGVFDDFGLINGDLKCVIGHNRAKTSGANTKENAHPFEFSHIIGAHNGTLKAPSLNKLDSEYGEVDSKRFYNAMNKVFSKEEGAKHTTVEGLIENVEGAMALTWWEKEAQILHMYKNEQRPLYYCASYDKRTFMWASEAWMLELAMNYENCRGEFTPIIPFADNTYKRIVITKDGLVKKKGKDVEVSFKQPVYAPINKGANNNTNHKGGGQKDNIPFRGNGDPIPQFVINGISYVSEHDFKRHWNTTCSCCMSRLDFPKDFNEVAFIANTREVLCGECGNESWVLDYWPNLTFGKVLNAPALES